MNGPMGGGPMGPQPMDIGKIMLAEKTTYEATLHKFDNFEEKCIQSLKTSLLA